MRRIVVVAPDLLGAPLQERLPHLNHLVEHGRLFIISPMPAVETPEALFLGMRPEEGQMRQGPLTIAALGADPPDRSTHFHLSLASLQDGSISFPEESIDPFDVARVLDMVQTRTLIPVIGAGTDHGLVWEGLGDLGTTAPDRNNPIQMSGSLPEGDNEIALRRLIDDSVNILMESEANRRREELELPPLNILWPWGNGVRPSVPNLMLRHGERAIVESPSRRLFGLTRLAGYRHEPIELFGKRSEPGLQGLSNRAFSRPLSIIAFDPAAYPEDEEKSAWFLRELDRLLASSVAEATQERAVRFTLLAPSSSTGLGFQFETRLSQQNDYPFDERSLEERKLPTLSLHEAVTQGL
jgi:hypothetical protein